LPPMAVSWRDKMQYELKNGGDTIKGIIIEGISVPVGTSPADVLYKAKQKMKRFPETRKIYSISISCREISPIYS